MYVVIEAAASITALVTVTLQTIKAIHSVIDEVKHSSGRIQRFSDRLDDLVHTLDSVTELVCQSHECGSDVVAYGFSGLRRSVRSCSLKIRKLQERVMKRRRALSGRVSRICHTVLGSKDFEDMTRSINPLLEDLNIQLGIAGRSVYESLSSAS